MPLLRGAQCNALMFVQNLQSRSLPNSMIFSSRSSDHEIYNIDIEDSPPGLSGKNLPSPLQYHSV